MGLANGTAGQRKIGGRRDRARVICPFPSLVCAASQVARSFSLELLNVSSATADLWLL